VLFSALRWGCLLAVATFAWTMMVHWLGFYTSRIAYAATVDRLVIILPALFIFVAIRERHHRSDPRLTYFGGVMGGTLTALVAAPLTVAGLAFYHTFINPDWLSILVAHERSLLEASGASTETVAAQLSQLQQRADGPGHAVNGVIGGTLVGLLLSLVLTPVARRGPRQPEDGTA
jgi:hypothetical protein